VKPRTVAGLLRSRAESSRAGDVAIRFFEDEGWVEWSWQQYWQASRHAQAGLVSAGVRTGDHVLVAIPQVRPAVTALFGMWALGAVPVQIAPVVHPRDPRAYFEQVSAIGARVDARFLLVPEDLAAAAAVTGLRLLTPRDLSGDPEASRLADPDVTAGVAFLQLTSGSTSHPRAVVVPHDRLMLHMASMSRALPSHRHSCAVSWLPLHHDMGLLGGLLFPFYNGFAAHMIATEDFRRRPSIWLETMSRFGGTITSAPPSGYAVSVPLAPRLLSGGIDLSAWECAMIGAEPISAALLRRFSEAFAPAGFRSQAFFPVYGLAEATVAVTFPDLLAGARIDRVDRTMLQRDGVAVSSEGEEAIELVGVGRAIPESEIRIVDESGDEVPERIAGEIEVRSKSASPGYYADPDATCALWRGEWLRTGDIGYIAGGMLFVTGRKKELIIKGGHNLIPSVIEEIVSEVEAVRAGGVAAVGLWSEALQTELLCVVAETPQDPADYGDVANRIRAALNARGVTPDRIVAVPPRTLPRTTSGKLQRVRISTMLSSEWNASGHLTPMG
jgi:acyl-CoA synthetase (AMP-forming)/AMP-acid ligase II